MSLLKAENVTKTFGGLRALHDVSFHIDKGEILGLIGPNGAGKTTLFNVIAGVFKPDRGKIQFNGRVITGLSPFDLCDKGIVRTFQLTKPFLNITVLENVMIGGFCRNKDLRDARRTSADILEFVGLGPKVNLLATNLTLEDRKRLEMARALATKPTLLLLDEVMAGLTLIEIEHTLTLIERVKDEGISIFFVEHVMKAMMSISNRIIVLNHGEKIAEGTARDIAENPSVIEAYLGKSYAF